MATVQKTQNLSFTFVLNGGPSREELFDSLRLYNERRPVRFMLEMGHLVGEHEAAFINVVIQSVGVEDGSGQSWLITGYNTVNEAKVEGWYDSKNRKGRLTVTPK